AASPAPAQRAPARKPVPYAAPRVIAPPAGALLPWRRIVTYYGNPMSARMGILGQMPPEQMMDALAAQAEEWRRADPRTPVQPGLELVATVADGKPGPSGLYRTRMPDAMIRRVIGEARSRGWITILDVQVGRAKVKDEVERLVPYLRSPDVHLALDPEFDMPPGGVPGRRIGTMDASEINDAIAIVAPLVTRYGLPPKILLVHRFTDRMVVHHDRIRRDPRVQVVMVMDGYGIPALKRMIYRVEIRREPVQYAGIKLFYKNDKPLMSAKEVLSLQPGPSVIIYQ
ncbi:MAG: hypothetical protein KGM24_04905, partial [Elusimicrobia bacterium]|nr:hypothetical protein [Elusimicrobiota bacterium]